MHCDALRLMCTVLSSIHSALSSIHTFTLLQHIILCLMLGALLFVRPFFLFFVSPYMLCLRSLCLILTVHCIYMCPALLCKSSIQSGNPEQCTLAFTHLLSSSCTSYFVPFHTYVCAYCKCISLVV